MAVTPLDYRQMRLLAEAALSQSGEPATFVVNGDSVELVPPDATPPSEGVLVPTRNPTKRSALGYLTFQVPWTGADGTPTLVSLDVARRFHADAVFWSDAAVKKFVQPYTASCAGSSAVDTLEKLLLAWNGIAAGAQPFALVHVTWPAPTGPAEMETMWIAFLRIQGPNAGQADALPITAYLAEFSPQPPLGGMLSSVPYERPGLSSGTEFLPDYAGLRALAEWSMSLNGTPRYFLFDPVTNSYSPPSTTLPPVVGSQIVIPVQNLTAPANPLQPRGVWLQPPNDAGPVDLAETADAVFWSTGAIEQFLLPYYASVDGFGGLPDLQKISDAWNDNVPGGGGGPPVNLYPEGGTGGNGTTLDGNNEVYGLVHLPQSAWVSLEDSLSSVEIAMVHTPRAPGRGTAVTPARDFHRGTKRTRE
jgi:hypothetical protein